MNLKEQQRKGWLYTCTPSQRQLFFSTVGEWAHGIGLRTDLDPLESRAMYRVLAQQLRDLVQRDFGVGSQVSGHLERQWKRLSPSAKSLWVRAAGGWFEWDSPGRAASEVISSCLSPPGFATIATPQQRDLLNQIGREVRHYLANDAQWYGSHTEAHRVLARAIHGLQKPDEEPAYWSAVRWSHVDAPQRGAILKDIAGVASRTSYQRSLGPETRESLQDLARSADWIADLHRPRVMIRE